MDVAFFSVSGEASRQALVTKAAAVNAKIGRNTMSWQNIEPIQGARDWSKLDLAVNDLLAAGIEPLLVISGSPPWANGNSDMFVIPATGPAFDAWVAKYQNFVAAGIARYKDRVRKWELWNEENDIGFWKPVPSITQYAAWYTATFNTIRAIDPTAEISMGGMSGLCCTGPNGIPGRTFLQRLYTAGVFPEIVNVHPYSDHAPNVHVNYQGNFDDIDMIHQIMLANGQGARPMWVTEWGWATGAGWSTAVTEAQQASYIDTSLTMLKTLYPYVKVATYFWTQDASPYPTGLYRVDGTLKPGGVTFRDFAFVH